MSLFYVRYAGEYTDGDLFWKTESTSDTLSEAELKQIRDYIRKKGYGNEFVKLWIPLRDSNSKEKPQKRKQEFLVSFSKVIGDGFCGVRTIPIRSEIWTTPYKHFCEENIGEMKKSVDGWHHVVIDACIPLREYDGGAR